MAAPEIKLFATFAELAAAVPKRGVVGIDIPMGLPDVTIDGGRPCEVAARARLGAGRSASIFSTPSRAALYEKTYEACCAKIRRELPHRLGISKQAWMIAPKVREVDLAVRAGLPFKLQEAHPEVIFARMQGGQGLRESKKTKAGRALRLKLLRRHRIGVSDALAQRPQGCGEDDVIDALACLWTAHRIARGEAEGLGEVEPYFGQRTGIWV